MVPVYPNKLSAHVAASNLVNQIRNDLIRPVYEAWSNMLGRKVLKADGDLTKEAKSIKVGIDCEKYGLLKGNCHMWLDGRSSSHSVRYTLWVDVHYSYMSGGWGEIEPEERQSHMKAESSLIIGKVENRKLVNIETPPVFRTDYSVQQVLQARKELKEIEEKVREIKSRICHFGEY